MTKAEAQQSRDDLESWEKTVTMSCPDGTRKFGKIEAWSDERDGSRSSLCRDHERYRSAKCTCRQTENWLSPTVISATVCARCTINIKR
jgi:hypothetical protein